MRILPFNDNLMSAAIVRILAGAGTEADEAALRAWLSGRPDRARQLEELRAVWVEAGALQQDWDTAALQERILRVTRTPTPIVRTVVDTRTLPVDGAPRRRAELWQPLVPRRWWSFAAAAAVTLVVGASVWLARGALHSGTASGRPSFTEVMTRRGQRATLQLPDGTRVTLGVDSRLRYAEPFVTGGRRDVYLEGEGYFEVAHDAARPFRVHAGEAVTRVLGTRFGVRAYPDDRTVRVVVAEGKVGFGRGSVVEVVLGGGDVGTLPATGAPTVQRGVDVSSSLAWVDGRLSFADTPVRDVVMQISRWYDLDVRLGDQALADLPYTISLRGDEPPDQVLHTLAAAIRGRVVRHGTAYVILRQLTVGER